jgi:hypothetical protein
MHGLEETNCTLELVPSREPLPMLVVGQAKN